MKILHIGDLHYRKGNKYEQAKIIEALLNAIQKEADINVCFFSGDLINSGANQSDFKTADEFLFKPILEKIQIQRSRPGEQAITNKRIEETLTPAVGGANTESHAQQQLRRKTLNLY